MQLPMSFRWSVVCLLCMWKPTHLKRRAQPVALAFGAKSALPSRPRQEHAACRWSTWMDRTFSCLMPICSRVSGPFRWKTLLGERVVRSGP